MVMTINDGALGWDDVPWGDVRCSIDRKSSQQTVEQIKSTTVSAIDGCSVDFVLKSDVVVVVVVVVVDDVDEKNDVPITTTKTLVVSLW